jgi:hypothetical protein
MHTKAEEIIAAGTSYVGVRYREQGRNMAGLDCAGVIICAGVDSGAFPPDAIDTIPKNYGRRPDVAEFTLSMVNAGCVRLPFGEQEHGDILRVAYGGWPVHVGLYEVDDKDREWIIHAYLPLKLVVRERLSHKIYVDTVWRYPG